MHIILTLHLHLSFAINIAKANKKIPVIFSKYLAYSIGVFIRDIIPANIITKKYIPSAIFAALISLKFLQNNYIISITKILEKT